MTNASASRPQGQLQRWPLEGTDLTMRLLAHDELAEAQLDEVIELLRRAFNGGPSWFDVPVPPREHLRWKMAPAGDPARCTYIQLLEDPQQRIKGFGLRTAHHFLLKGREITADEGFDSALDPEYQGRRVNSARRKQRRELGVDNRAAMSVSYGTHPTSRSRRGVLRLGEGLSVGNPIETLVKPLSPRAFLGSGGRGPLKTQAAGVSRTRAAIEGRRGLRSRLNRESVVLAARLGWSLARRQLPTRADPRISTIASFDERAETFWRRASEPFEFIQVRDRAYLNWRYCDPRAGVYEVRLAEEHGDVAGYSVLRSSSGSAVLEDLLTLPGRPDLAWSLIADATRLAREQGAHTLRAWMPRSHPSRELLRAAGFVRYTAPMRLVYTPQGAPAEELAFLQAPDVRLHLMSADTDHR